MVTTRSLNDNFQPGDLVLFAGTCWESRWIAAVTCTPWQWLQRTPFSHVGICARDPNDVHGRVLIFESTTLTNLPCEITHKRIKGTQAHSPASRIPSYEGKVWRFRLTTRNALMNNESRRLSDFLLSEIGKPYDYEGAAICVTRWLRLCEFVYPTMDKLFCSYYAMAALKDIRKVDQDLNPRAYNPARMIRDLVRWGTYQPLSGKVCGSVQIK